MAGHDIVTGHHTVNLLNRSDLMSKQPADEPRYHGDSLVMIGGEMRDFNPLTRYVFTIVRIPVNPLVLWDFANVPEPPNTRYCPMLR